MTRSRAAAMSRTARPHKLPVASLSDFGGACLQSLHHHNGAEMHKCRPRRGRGLDSLASALQPALQFDSKPRALPSFHLGF